MKTSPLQRQVRRLPGLIALATALLLAGGCSVVRVAQPVGEKPLVIEKAEWEGAWVDGTGEMFFQSKVADAAKGELLLIGAGENDGKPTVKTQTVHLRESGGWTFASYVDADDPDKAKGLVWGRVQKGRDLVLVWAPDTEKFQELVRQGKLRGKPDGSDVILEALSADDLKALTSGALGVPFVWDEPLVFRRVAKGPASEKPTDPPPAASPPNPASPADRNSAISTPSAR